MEKRLCWVRANASVIQPSVLRVVIQLLRGSPLAGHEHNDTFCLTSTHNWIYELPPLLEIMHSHPNQQMLMADPSMKLHNFFFKLSRLAVTATSWGW